MLEENAQKLTYFTVLLSIILILYLKCRLYTDNKNEELQQLIALHGNKMFPHTNILNEARYLTCPFHEVANSAFACHKYSLQRTQTILSYQLPPKFDFHDPSIQLKMTNKTFIFVGDSLMRNQYISLACLLWEFDSSIKENVNTEIKSYTFLQIYSKKLNLLLIFQKQYTLFNEADPQKILFHDNSSNLEMGNEIKNIFRKKIGSSVIPKNSLRKHNSNETSPFTVADQNPIFLVISTGHHYDWYFTHNDQTCDGLGQPQNCSLERISWANFGNVINIFNSQLLQFLSSSENVYKNESIQVVWRSVPTRHFTHGEWNSNGTCDSRQPCISDAIDQINDTTSPYYKSYQLSSILHQSAIHYNLSFLDISRTMDRCDAHVSNVKGKMGAGRALEDCNHYCVPGVPDTWHDGLLNFL